MRTRLITAVAAAALLAGGSMALAQGGEGHRDSGAAGASQEHGGAGGMSREGGASGGKGAGERMGQGGGEKAGAGEKSGAGEKARMDSGEKTGAREKTGAGEKTKAAGGEKAGAGEKTGAGEKSKMGAGDRDERKADTGDKGDKGDRADRGDHGDRDRADRGGGDNVHVNIRVGGPIPEGRHLVPLRTTLIERYPQYRGFEMFEENDEIVIVDPGTRTIVRTVSEGEAGMNHAASTDCR